MNDNTIPKHESMSRIPVAFLILGYENNRKAIIDFLRKARTTINWVTDAIQPTVSSKIEWLEKEIADARERGVVMKQISDITPENLDDCKKRMSRIDELRHLAGIRVVFGFSDFEFFAMVPTLGPRKEVRETQFIESDSESVLAYKQLIFGALWERAIPSQLRIDELEGKAPTVNSSTNEIRNVIDRIYACLECKKTFVFSHEVEEHKKTTGHGNYREYPLV
jgi:hypothetical protein